MKNQMKKYVFPLGLYLVTLMFGLVIYKMLEPYLIREWLSLITRAVLALAFLTFIIKYVKNSNDLFQLEKISKVHIGLVLFLFSLFAINNYFYSVYSTNMDYLKTSALDLVIVGFIVNSFFEEFAYRGFLQGYVNQNSRTLRQPISRGNLFASSLMLISHLGFFTVMDTLFAITGLLLVFVFSLVLGYMRDQGASIWFLIIVHTVVNFIHLIINLHHYI